VREGWVEKRLSEVCEGKITDGTHQTPKYFDDGYTFLSSKNVANKVIDWEKVKYIDETQHIAMQKRLSPKKGDILLAKNGTTGVAAMVDRDEIFDIYVSLALLRPSEEVLPAYMLHFINSNLAKEQFNQRLKGAGVPNLHLKEIRDVVIPLPPLPIQKRIVAILDEAFDAIDQAIANTEQNLQNARELFESYLNKVFSEKSKEWEEKRLGELCSIARGSSPRPIKNFISTEKDGVNWIKIGDGSKSSKYIDSTKQKITKEGAKRSRKVKKGDFLLSNSMSFGKAYILRIDGCIHDGWFALSAKFELFDRDYLYYFLSSAAAVDQFENLATGAIVRNINRDLVSRVIVPIPSIFEQKKIVANSEELHKSTDSLKLNLLGKIDALKELKQFILQKAFTGELTEDYIEEQGIL
jgi:type I restriction enzyme, S subunit